MKRSEAASDLIFECEEVTQPEGAALKALHEGKADEYQQRLVLGLIVNKFSRPHDQTYVPGSEGRTAFMSGRAFVGQLILKYLKLPVSKLPEISNADE